MNSITKISQSALWGLSLILFVIIGSSCRCEPKSLVVHNPQSPHPITEQDKKSVSEQRPVTKNSYTEKGLPRGLSFETTAFSGTRAWVRTSNSPYLFMSKDAGATWDVVKNVDFSSDALIYFLDDNNGWAVSRVKLSDAMILRTYDGGLSWHKIGLIGGASHYEDVSTLSKIIFIDNLHGWILDLGNIWFTEDGGNTWGTMPKTDLETVTPFVIITGQGVWWRYGKTKQGFYSQDNGATWESRLFPIAPSTLSFADKQVGWLCGFTNDLLEIHSTTDGGNSWALIFKSEQKPAVNGPVPQTSCYALDLINQTEGWVAITKAGFNKKKPSDSDQWRVHGFLLHTIDAGKSWQIVEVNKSIEEIWEIAFPPNGQHGWVETGNTIFRTMDGGYSSANTLIIK